MFALTLIPCGDGGGGILEITNHLLGVEHAHSSDHEKHSRDCGDDTCSPFCICSCCSSTLDTPIKVPLKVKSFSPIPDKVPYYISNIIYSSFQSSIWQPPKFS